MNEPVRDGAVPHARERKGGFGRWRMNRFGEYDASGSRRALPRFPSVVFDPHRLHSDLYASNCPNSTIRAISVGWENSSESGSVHFRRQSTIQLPPELPPKNSREVSN